MQPLIFTQWFFCSICYLGWLEAFSPQLVDSNMPLNPSLPSTRDRISLNGAQNRPVFCCCFDSGTKEITLWIKKRTFPLLRRTARFARLTELTIWYAWWGNTKERKKDQLKILSVNIFPLVPIKTNFSSNLRLIISWQDSE